MRILALDAATAACSVALWGDGVVLALARHLEERGLAAAHIVRGNGS